MTAEIPKLFLACCHDGPARLAIDKPFPAGEYIAATDGAILVRIKKADAPWAKLVRPARGMTPPVSDCGWSEKFGAPVRFFELPPAETEKCEDCEGRGTYTVGRAGSPVRTELCEACGGRGTWPMNRRIVRDNERNVGLAEKYVRLLWEAGVREIQPTDPWDVQAKKPLRWQLGAIEGLLMPVASRHPEWEVRR